MCETAWPLHPHFVTGQRRAPLVVANYSQGTTVGRRTSTYLFIYLRPCFSEPARHVCQLLFHRRSPLRAPRADQTRFNRHCRTALLSLLTCLEQWALSATSREMFQLDGKHCCRFFWRVAVCRRVFLRAPCCFGRNDSTVMHWLERSCSFISIVPRAGSAWSLPICFLGASFWSFRFRITKQFHHGRRLRVNGRVWMLQLSRHHRVINTDDRRGEIKI